MSRRRTRSRMDSINRLQQGSRQAHAGDRVDYSFYDSMKLLSTVTETRLFQNAVGQSGKTLAETNMKVSGSIPQGSNFRAHVIKVFYTTSSAKLVATNFFNFLKNTTLEIILDGKADLGTYTLSEIFGNPLCFDTDATVEGNMGVQGFSTFKGVLPLNFPIDLAALQQFEVKIRQHVASDATLDNDKLQVSLNGRLYRLS